MDETVKQENEKTFNQSELDTIIADRLKREREKYADYDSLKEKAAKLDEIEEATKTELQRATEKAEKLEAELSQMKKAEEIRTIREKVSQETGVPAALLSGESEETCKDQAIAIMSFKTSASSYPTIKDGGEIQTTVKGSTRQQFADWMKDALG